MGRCRRHHGGSDKVFLDALWCLVVALLRRMAKLIGFPILRDPCNLFAHVYLFALLFSMCVCLVFLGLWRPDSIFNKTNL